MNSDIPAQLILHPPTTDVECSPWGLLASALYHRGLIWRRFDQAVISDSPPKLRLLCTFTDQYAYDTWRSHPAISAAYAEVLATSIEVTPIATPWEKHEQVCQCTESSQMILRGHGFGDSRAILYCADCSGYYPPYRVQNQFGDLHHVLDPWALVTVSIYEIWLTSSVLEAWAEQQLSDPASEINVAGFAHTTKLYEYTGKPIWYHLFTESVEVNSTCPKCHEECEATKWAEAQFQCDRCHIMY